MRPGELRLRVTIQRQTVTGKDTLNNDIVKWTDVATVWAQVIDLSGREFFASQQANAEITTRVRIRFRTGITASMRVVYGSRTLELVSPPIDPDGHGRELYLMCKELV